MAGGTGSVSEPPPVFTAFLVQLAVYRPWTAMEAEALKLALEAALVQFVGVVNADGNPMDEDTEHTSRCGYLQAWLHGQSAEDAMAAVWDLTHQCAPTAVVIGQRVTAVHPPA